MARFAFTAVLVSASFASAQSSPQRPSPVPLALDDPSIKTAPASTPQPPSAVLDTPSVGQARDRSALESPVTPVPRTQTLQIGTVLSVRMAVAVSSGLQRNGDTVRAVLASPIQTAAGTTLPRGASVEATVVSAARAGTMSSGGVLSLQLTRVAGVPIITDVLDFSGQEGHKDVADSAPQKGTEAIVQPGALLSFHVMENGPATGLAPKADEAGGGSGSATPPSGSGGRNQPMPPATASPEDKPGANQRVVPGTTQQINPPAKPPTS